MPEQIFNILIVSDPGVGKTSLINKLKGLEFSPTYIPTPVNQTCEVLVRYKGYALNFIEYPNQLHHQEFHMAIIMCSLCKKSTVESIPEWIETITEITPNFILFANKLDCARKQAMLLWKTYKNNFGGAEFSIRDSNVESLLFEIWSRGFTRN